jgi:hypothetical protein
MSNYWAELAAGASRAFNPADKLKQHPVEHEQVDDVVFVRPTGWQRKDNPDGSVILIPPGLTPLEAFVMINWSKERGGATLREHLGDSWHKMLVAIPAKVAPGVKIQNCRSNGCQVVFTVEVFQPVAGERVHSSVSSAGPLERVQGIVFVASRQSLYLRYAGAVATLLENICLANTQRAQSPYEAPARALSVAR